ncbi:hypothetical protein BS50DRAFT_621707 [Corynespora cassiicola Philippines]|uniref:GPI anchored protein n=1 Tax=Corynespora cassiicola Philippines TaxID=1448308 RepID=A0A2T2NKG2_CORCC|nr:hypothetical protein BS50DRAFT_621707 [Corynespora cassiicola Philippines]
MARGVLLLVLGLAAAAVTAQDATVTVGDEVYTIPMFNPSSAQNFGPEPSVPAATSLSSIVSSRRTTASLSSSTSVSSSSSARSTSESTISSSSRSASSSATPTPSTTQSESETSSTQSAPAEQSTAAAPARYPEIMGVIAGGMFAGLALA